MLSDRNRVDFRWVNDKFSVRYRNRLTLEREFTIGERSYTPYASIEAYYDSRSQPQHLNAIGVATSFYF